MVHELGGGSSSTGATLLEPPTHRASFSTPHNNLTGCGGNAEDKQLAQWERRAKALRKMLLGFDQARKTDCLNYRGIESFVLIIQSVTPLRSTRHAILGGSRRHRHHVRHG